MLEWHNNISNSRTYNHISDTLQELDLEMEMKSRLSMAEQETNTYNLLDEMCDELKISITSKAALLYPSLVEALGHLELEKLLQIHQQINSGRLCPHHQRLR